MNERVLVFAVLVLCFVCHSQCFQISYSQPEYDVFVHIYGDLKGQVPVPVKLQKDLEDLKIPKTLSFRVYDFFNAKGEINNGSVELSSGRNKFNNESSEFDTKRSEFVTSELKNGSSEVRNGGSEIRNGSSEIRNGSSEIRNGSSEIQNGSSEVKNGSNEFNSPVSTLAPAFENYSVAYQELEILAGDLVLQLDFWPDFDDFSHDILHFSKPWKLKLVFDLYSQQRPYLRSYSLQATFAHVQFVQNHTQIWSSGTFQTRSSFHISHCCPKSFEERSAYLHFHHDLYPNLKFTHFCASVETSKYECSDGNDDSTYEIQYSTRRYYPRSALMYISLYLLQIMLIVSASLTFFLLISKWSRKRKERLRVLPKVSYIYGKQPSLQIIPSTTLAQHKDVSQNVYY